MPKQNEKPLVAFSQTGWEGPWEATTLEPNPEDGSLGAFQAEERTWMWENSECGGPGLAGVSGEQRRTLRRKARRRIGSTNG